MYRELSLHRVHWQLKNAHAPGHEVLESVDDFHGELIPAISLPIIILGCERTDKMELSRVESTLDSLRCCKAD